MACWDTKYIHELIKHFYKTRMHVCDWFYNFTLWTKHITHFQRLDLNKKRDLMTRSFAVTVALIRFLLSLITKGINRISLKNVPKNGIKIALYSIKIPFQKLINKRSIENHRNIINIVLKRKCIYNNKKNQSLRVFV